MNFILINEKTSERLKQLEKYNVQTNVLIATILDSYDLESLISEFNEDELSKNNSDSGMNL